MSLHFNILTLFPDMFPGSLGLSLSGRALEEELWSYRALNIRDYAHGVHKAVDDTPYGGGAGMVMRADVIEKSLTAVPDYQETRLIYLSPRGRPLMQDLVQDMAQPGTAMTLLCGRYEGVDQRILDAYGFEEISIGDYVLSGGEPAALILMDACIRLLPGVMGNNTTVDEESFASGLLEYPHYTRPTSWTDVHGHTHDVPAVLRSGNHKVIKEWRVAESQEITRRVRPDLWQKFRSDRGESD